MLRTFTLDTNCLIDIEENRPAASAIRTLADAHASALADVAVTAMSASEKQKDHRYREDFDEFLRRLATLQIAHLNVVSPMMYWDISFWDHFFWHDDAMLDLERRIHTILFPNEQFLWEQHCHDMGIDPRPAIPEGKWRNHKCDVQAIWSHIHSNRDVFVTSDGNFHKRKSDLIALGAGQIEYPDSAVKLLGGIMAQTHQATESST
jgi:hypothetical protein